MSEASIRDLERRYWSGDTIDAEALVRMLVRACCWDRLCSMGWHEGLTDPRFVRDVPMATAECGTYLGMWASGCRICEVVISVPWVAEIHERSRQYHGTKVWREAGVRAREMNEASRW